MTASSALTKPALAVLLMNMIFNVEALIHRRQNNSQDLPQAGVPLTNVLLDCSVIATATAPQTQPTVQLDISSPIANCSTIEIAPEGGIPPWTFEVDQPFDGVNDSFRLQITPGYDGTISCQLLAPPGAPQLYIFAYSANDEPGPGKLVDVLPGADASCQQLLLQSSSMSTASVPTTSSNQPSSTPTSTSASSTQRFLEIGLPIITVITALVAAVATCGGIKSRAWSHFWTRVVDAIRNTVHPRLVGYALFSFLFFFFVFPFA